MSSQLQTLLRYLERKPPAGVCDDGKISYVLDMGDPAFAELTVAAEIVAPKAASVPTPIKDSTLFARAVTVRSGPRTDGATKNVAVMFIGGAGVNVNDGWPLDPDEGLALESIDLSKLFFLTTNAADRLRVVYIA